MLGVPKLSPHVMLAIAVLLAPLATGACRTSTSSPPPQPQPQPYPYGQGPYGQAPPPYYGGQPQPQPGPGPAQPGPQPQPGPRPLLAPLVGVPAWQQEVRNVLNELVNALPQN